jgi:GDP-L-fucose synthase
MNKDSKIFVAGHRGLVGSAMVRVLQANGFRNLVLRGRDELDLRHQSAVDDFFRAEKPDIVFLAAARVGGILANNIRRADFIYDNLMIEANVIHAAFHSEVSRLVFLGSNCIYPKICEQPIREEFLLTGALEPTNEPYAIAKIAGAKLCESFNRQHGTRYLTAMPANLYGIGDHYDLETCHVLPALIRKIHEAKLQGQEVVTVWGTGEPRREFMFADDLADACLFLAGLKDFQLDQLFTEPGGALFNVGTGFDLKIKEVAEQICDVMGYQGRLVFDTSKPDGTPKKLLDPTRLLRLGWRPRVELHEGINRTYDAFLSTPYAIKENGFNDC